MNKVVIFGSRMESLVSSWFALLLMTACMSVRNQTTTPDFYQQALSLITDWNQTNRFSASCEEKACRVSREVISVSAFEFLFRKEIESRLDEYHFSEIPDIVVVEQERSLEKLGNSRSPCVIFFSEIKDGLLFAELFMDSKGLSRYIDRPHFGTSQVYMFLVSNGEIHLVKSKELIYN